MYDSHSRIVYENGLCFYEEDLIYDNHTYSGNLNITIDLDYYQNGFGVFFYLKAGAPLASQNLYYFLKIGYQEASLFLVNDSYYERIGHYGLTHNAPQQHLTFVASLEESYLTLTINNEHIGKTKLPLIFSNYSLGYYSQRGNTIHSVMLKAPFPYAWRFNLDTTYGGRISFDEDRTFVKSNGAPIEIIQEIITLEEGVYYLKYEQTGDLKPIVYSIHNEHPLDEYKNILEDNIFILQEPDELVLKFIGTYGELQSIQITECDEHAYVSTRKESGKQDSSHITLTTNNIEKLECEFDYFSSIEPAYLFKDIFNSIPMPDLTPGRYLLQISDSQVQVIQNDEVLHAFAFAGNNITLFVNTSIIVYHFTITQKNGQIIDWFKQEQFKEYIPQTINTPIIVTDSAKKPYDLSASYRIVNDRYIFTNVEREHFKTSACCSLTTYANSIRGVYGIPNELNCNKDFIYFGTQEDMHDLTTYASYYDVLDYTFDEKYNQVIINSPIDYQEIIIDYVKKDSYCINFNPKLFAYEVEITRSNYHIYYEEKNILYHVTSLLPQENYYTVLRKKD